MSYKFCSIGISTLLACGAIGTAFQASDVNATITLSGFNPTQLAMSESKEIAAQNEAALSTFAGIKPDPEINGDASDAWTFGSRNGVANIRVVPMQDNLMVGSGEKIAFPGESGDVFVLNIGARTMSDKAAIGISGKSAMIIRNFSQFGLTGTIPQVDSVFNATAFGVLYTGVCTVVLMFAEMSFRRIVHGREETAPRLSILLRVPNPPKPVVLKLGIPIILFDKVRGFRLLRKNELKD